MYHPVLTAMFQMFIGGTALSILVYITLEEVKRKRR